MASTVSAIDRERATKRHDRVFGLADANIARRRAEPPAGGFAASGQRRTNVEYVLSRKPNSIPMMRQMAGAPERWPHLLPAVEVLWAHPDFDGLYE